MVEYLRYNTDETTTVATARRAYEASRNLVDYVESKVGTTTISKYDYTNDALGRRTFVAMSGSALDWGIGSQHWDYGYAVTGTSIDRGELNSAVRGAGTTLGGTPFTSFGDFDYAYDNIGNRTSSNVDNASTATTYTRNAVNQYTSTANPAESFGYDADGNLTSDAPVGPKLLSAKSIKQHGTAGEFGIDLPLTSSQSANAGIECRAGGPTIVELEFSEQVAITTSNVVLSSGTCDSVVQMVDALQTPIPTYRLALSGVTADSCLGILLKQVAGKQTGRPLVGPAAVYVVYLKGDVDGSGTVDSTDRTQVTANYSPLLVTQTNFRYDITLDGRVNATDVSALQPYDRSASCATLPPASLGLAYSWDGENRLTKVITRRDPADTFYVGDHKVEFVYDYMGRRVRKTASTYGSSGWAADSDEMFAYDGWNVVLVLNALSSNAMVRQYTWGLDLSGQSGQMSVAGMHGAGGIGGLLAAEEPQTSGGPKKYWFCYDANGNVGQVLDATNTGAIATVAAYEYDPYGNGLVATGSYATLNPFRFSTKWLDTEASLYYYAYRYYSPRLGRVLNRDPLEEVGGINLYVIVRNDPICEIDPLGLTACTASDRCCTEWTDGYKLSGFTNLKSCFVSTLSGISNTAATGIAGVLGTAVGGLSKSGLTSVVAALGALGIQLADVWMAFDLCHDQWCTKDRQADEACAFFGVKCGCYDDNGLGDFTPVGTRRGGD
jgi:RHS repeat-associated protein